MKTQAQQNHSKITGDHTVIFGGCQVVDFTMFVLGAVLGCAFAVIFERVAKCLIRKDKMTPVPPVFFAPSPYRGGGSLGTPSPWGSE